MRGIALHVLSSRALLLLALLALTPCGAAQSTSTVGVPAELRDVILPGSELVPDPGDFSAPIVLRILATRRHGDAHRYDISWYGLDPGTYDLRDYLKRRDGSELGADIGLEVTVETLLPAGQVEPHRPERSDVPSLGGYRILIFLAAGLWLAGLLCILLVGKTKRREAEAPARPRTLADRLRPLVEDAQEGKLSLPDRGKLELLLITYWRRKLDLADTGAAQALTRLRSHSEAGPLFKQLERWLHSPGTDQDVDLRSLLAPYEGVSENAVGIAPRKSIPAGKQD